MSLRIVFIILTGLLLFPSCQSSQKAAQQRRNLMMPHRDEIPRNSKYKDYKPKKYKAKKTKKKR